MNRRWASALSRTRLFSGVDLEDLLRLAARGRQFELDSGDLLFTAGDPCKGLFVVVEGRTRAVRHGMDGREQIIHEDSPGSTFPEVAVFDDGPCPSSVFAVEDTVLLFIPKEEVKAFFLRHPEVALTALRVLSTRLRRATGMVEELALRGVSQRLAEYLLTRAAEGPSEKLLRLKHTNQEIADLIGSVREVVSRSFARLQREGWIEKRGRVVEVIDRRGLRGHIEGM